MISPLLSNGERQNEPFDHALNFSELLPAGQWGVVNSPEADTDNINVSNNGASTITKRTSESSSRRMIRSVRRSRRNLSPLSWQRLEEFLRLQSFIRKLGGTRQCLPFDVRFGRLVPFFCRLLTASEPAKSFLVFSCRLPSRRFPMAASADFSLRKIPSSRVSMPTLPLSSTSYLSSCLPLVVRPEKGTRLNGKSDGGALRRQPTERRTP